MSCSIMITLATAIGFALPEVANVQLDAACLGHFDDALIGQGLLQRVGTRYGPECA